ncbi:hypothetical protein B0H13DRAFT_2660298 [Mycena leptocephala]|nr:hypothetical protein B0H13DRAFT_2660298 [Mycena leptocephala]
MPLVLSSSSVIVEVWFHGLYTSAMLVTLWLIFYGKNYPGTRRFTQLAIVVVPWILSTIHAALIWQWFAGAVDNNEAPTGPGLAYSLAHHPAWLAGVGDTVFALNIFLADIVFIWRCWCVWNRRWVVIVLPALATLVGLILAGFLIHYQVSALQAATPVIAEQTAAKFVSLNTVYFSLSIATSLTTTLLIALRILLVQRSLQAVLNARGAVDRDGQLTHKDLNPVIEILIESAILYSVTLLTFVVFDIEKSANLTYAQNVHAQMAGLAPLLIILRILAGKARPQTDWSTQRFLTTTTNDARTHIQEASDLWIVEFDLST